MAKKRISSSIVAACLSITMCFAAGCGSSGGDGGASPHSSTPITNSSYKGAYKGGWSTHDQYGYLDINVGSNGMVSGWLWNDTRWNVALLSGTVYEDGWIELSYRYGDERSTTVSGTVKRMGNSLLVTGQNKVGGETKAMKSNLVNLDAGVDLTGRWQRLFDNVADDGYLMLSQNGSAVSGTYTYTPYSETIDEPVAGTLTGSRLKIPSFPGSPPFDGIVSTGFSCDELVPSMTTTSSSPAGCMFALSWPRGLPDGMQLDVIQFQRVR